MFMASLLRRTGGGVLGVELAPATGVETPTSVAFKNVGARLVGTVLPPFITIVFSLRPGSLFERSRERSRFPEGEILPSSATSIFLRWQFVLVPGLPGEHFELQRLVLFATSAETHFRLQNKP